MKVTDHFRKQCFKGLHRNEKYLGFPGLPKSDDWVL